MPHDDETVGRVHQALMAARQHLANALDAINLTANAYPSLKTPIQVKITALGHLVNDAFDAADLLTKDQSSWGKYQSHPAGNNN